LRSITISNELMASWASTTATSGVQAVSLKTTTGLVRDANGDSIGSGTVSLGTHVPIAIAISGDVQFEVTGEGAISFYGPAGNRFGVSCSWTSYAASLTGQV